MLILMSSLVTLLLNKQEHQRYIRQFKYAAKLMARQTTTMMMKFLYTYTRIDLNVQGV